MYRPSGETRGRVEVVLGHRQQHPPLAAGHVDHDQFAVRLARRVPLPPPGEHRGAVRRQLERLAVQRPSRLGRQVPQPGGIRRPFGPFGGVVGQHGFLVPAGPPDLRFLHLVGVDGEQPGLVGPQVVIPEPDRRGLVQDGGDPGVLALLAQPGVVRGAVAVARGRPGRPGRAPTTMPPASLATSAAVTPPGSAATTRASPPAAGSSQSAATSPASGSGLRGRVGTPGGEQQRSVRQEAGAALALGGPGQPGGPGRPGVDPPDAGQVLLLVGTQRLHRRREPGPVRGQPQRRHPRHRHEVAEIME